MFNCDTVQLGEVVIMAQRYGSERFKARVVRRVDHSAIVVLRFGDRVGRDEILVTSDRLDRCGDGSLIEVLAS